MSSLDWIERARRKALTVLLDLDGTLIPFADTVEKAELDRPAANLLDALGVAGVRVVIVSGRKRQHVERIAIANVWWVAEHGVWRRSWGDWEGSPNAAELDVVEADLAPIARVPQAIIERKTRSICVHWRSVANADRPEVIAMARGVFEAWTAARPEYSILDGVLALELRHLTANKGDAVDWVRAQEPRAHLIAIGDDHTDEDMFAKLRPDEVAIAVLNARDRETRASHQLQSPTAVREFLWWLVEVRTRRTERSPPITPIRAS